MQQKSLSAISVRLAAGLLLAGILLISFPAAAAGIKIGDDNRYLKLAVLLQGWAVFTHEAAADGESPDTDFYLRRMRILLIGQLNRWVNFFVETDNPNFGKGGEFESRMFIQDAWVEFNLHNALQLDIGMIMIPFSHHGMQGATSLHSVDYHTRLIRYPDGSHKVWRDFGAMIRGMLLNNRLEYRIAVFNGVHGKASDPNPPNPHDVPRVTGRLTLNLFDAEGGSGTGGFFYDGLYLKQDSGALVSPKKIVSFGVSADWQKDVNVILEGDPAVLKERQDYVAVALDAFMDLPLDDRGVMGLAGQFDFYYYQHGEDAEGTGFGFLFELGLRYDAYEVVVCADWFNATELDGDAGDLLAVYGGFNWWWFGHSTSLKVQLGGTKEGDADWGLAGHIQAQFLF